jgi:hypothetical protein
MPLDPVGIRALPELAEALNVLRGTRTNAELTKAAQALPVSRPTHPNRPCPGAHWATCCAESRCLAEGSLPSWAVVRSRPMMAMSPLSNSQISGHPEPPEVAPSSAADFPSRRAREAEGSASHGRFMASLPRCWNSEYITDGLSWQQ